MPQPEAEELRRRGAVGTVPPDSLRNSVIWSALVEETRTRSWASCSVITCQSASTVPCRSPLISMLILWSGKVVKTSARVGMRQGGPSHGWPVFLLTNSAREVEFPEPFERRLGDHGPPAGGVPGVGVVVHHQHIVDGGLHVELDHPGPGLEADREALNGVFGTDTSATAMGEVDRPVQRYRRPRQRSCSAFPARRPVPAPRRRPAPGRRRKGARSPGNPSSCRPPGSCRPA